MSGSDCTSLLTKLLVQEARYEISLHSYEDNFDTTVNVIAGDRYSLGQLTMDDDFCGAMLLSKEAFVDSIRRGTLSFTVADDNDAYVTAERERAAEMFLAVVPGRPVTHKLLWRIYPDTFTPNVDGLTDCQERSYAADIDRYLPRSWLVGRVLLMASRDRRSYREDLGAGD